MKTLVGQTRMIFTFSSIHRAGFAQDKALSIAQGGVEFLIDHFWDEQHGGWFWTTERDGSPLNESKIGYGHSFAMYALSEYGMASGDLRGMEWAVRTYETLQSFAADNLNGGYYEFFEGDWTKKGPGRGGGRGGAAARRAGRAERQQGARPGARRRRRARTSHR
ncbi:MAG: AGE family epimerase/isomerase [Proteobacteria bacterium]|nr:AGE family epimerase/isomerase [Pseudomonadota bacterium]